MGDPMARATLLAVVFGVAVLVGITAAPPDPPKSTDPASQTVTFQNGVDKYAGTVDVEIWAVAPNTCLEGNPNASTDADNDGGESQILMRFDGVFGDRTGRIPPGSTIVSA